MAWEPGFSKPRLCGLLGFRTRRILLGLGRNRGELSLWREGCQAASPVKVPCSQSNPERFRWFRVCINFLVCRNSNFGAPGRCFSHHPTACRLGRFGLLRGSLTSPKHSSIQDFRTSCYEQQWPTEILSVLLDQCKMPAHDTRCQSKSTGKAGKTCMSQWSDPSAYPPKNDCRGTSHSPAASPAGATREGRETKWGSNESLRLRPAVRRGMRDGILSSPGLPTVKLRVGELAPCLVRLKHLAG